MNLDAITEVIAWHDHNGIMTVFDVYNKDNILVQRIERLEGVCLNPYVSTICDHLLFRKHEFKRIKTINGKMTWLRISLVSPFPFYPKNV